MTATVITIFSVSLTLLLHLHHVLSECAHVPKSAQSLEYVCKLEGTVRGASYEKPGKGWVLAATGYHANHRTMASAPSGGVPHVTSLDRVQEGCHYTGAAPDLSMALQTPAEVHTAPQQIVHFGSIWLFDLHQKRSHLQPLLQISTAAFCLYPRCIFGGCVMRQSTHWSTSCACYRET